MKVYNKNEIIGMISNEIDSTKKNVEEVVNGFIDVVTDILKNGDKVLISGFMGLETKFVHEHEGKNPKTGETVTVPEKRKIKVSIGSTLKNDIQ